MSNHRRDSREGTHRVRESITPLGADGFYWKVKATEEGLGENWPFQPPIVFGADGTAETEDEARRHLETALALYRSRYLSPGGM